MNRLYPPTWEDREQRERDRAKAWEENISALVDHEPFYDLGPGFDYSPSCEMGPDIQEEHEDE